MAYECTFWYGELCHAAGVGNPDRLGHPAFTKFLKGLFVRPQSTFRAEIAEAKESLGSRLHPRRGTVQAGHENHCQSRKERVEKF